MQNQGMSSTVTMAQPDIRSRLSRGDIPESCVPFAFHILRTNSWRTLTRDNCSAMAQQWGAEKGVNCILSFHTIKRQLPIWVGIGVECFFRLKKGIMYCQNGIGSFFFLSVAYNTNGQGVCGEWRRAGGKRTREWV